jgi:hypothetical protein
MKLGFTANTDISGKVYVFIFRYIFEKAHEIRGAKGTGRENEPSNFLFSHFENLSQQLH